MRKFKVGDRVRVRSDRRGRLWNFDGLMDKYMGKVMTVSANPGGYTYELKECRGENGGGNWRWGEEDLSLVLDQKIIITTDGTTTLARLYEGNKVVKRAEAKCAPGDTFDFAVGANLAYDRLMQPEPEYYNGKVVCVDGVVRWFTAGKVYEFINGRVVDDEGDGRPVGDKSIPSLPEWNRLYGASIARFIEYKGEAQ